MSDGHKKVCIIAWPAGHSRSPLIHNYWIKQHKLDAEYLREAVPAEKLAEFIKSMRAQRLCRRQCHAAAQGSSARIVGAGRARERGRRRQYALVR